jgi:23S rRNA (adenine2503-C2)-methyltransferase
VLSDILSQEQLSSSIKAFGESELADIVHAAHQPAFRVRQLIKWLYGRNATSYDDMTDLPLSLRTVLKDTQPLWVPRLIERQIAADNTRKYLIEFEDGIRVEAVGIPTADRLTVCFSTQAGCAMGCIFCATGAHGFTRNLLPGEILDQIQIVADDYGCRVSNAVGMGQGEPFANYDAVLKALRFMNSVDGPHIGARHITVSTCGIIPMIDRFATEPEQFTLAISLHAAIQSTRDYIMPSVQGYPLKALRTSLLSYVEKTNRRPTLEYALISDINDSDEHLSALIDFCESMLVHVNLISLNPIAQTALKDAGKRRAQIFEHALTRAGIETSIRASRGGDISGACGQLAQEHSR